MPIHKQPLGPKMGSWNARLAVYLCVTIPVLLFLNLLLVQPSIR
jgi:hypothetical protein